MAKNKISILEVGVVFKSLKMYADDGLKITKKAKAIDDLSDSDQEKLIKTLKKCKNCLTGLGL